MVTASMNTDMMTELTMSTEKDRTFGMERWCVNGQPDSVPTELVLSDLDSSAAFLKSGIGKSCKKAVRIGNKLYFAEFFSSDFMDRGDERQGLSLGL